MKVKTKLVSQKLPGRGALQSLGKTGRSILDYGKATPVNDVRPSILQTNLKPKL
jgi:hypothetical protein